MVVFSVAFGRLAKIPSDGLPYPVFAYCALLPWQPFAHALTESGNSLVASQNLITKVYFPRLVIPLAAVLAGVVEGFRWALLGTAHAPGPMLAVSGAVVLALLLGGLYYFRRTEKTFADVV